MEQILDGQMNSKLSFHPVGWIERTNERLRVTGRKREDRSKRKYETVKVDILQRGNEKERG